MDLRIADDGDDRGRMVRMTPQGLELLVEDSLRWPDPEVRDEVAHAISHFRARNATAQERRSAIVTLAGILEKRRSLLKATLLSKDEGALFHIANKFDLRHRDGQQQSDYSGPFADWIFYWYLATVRLTTQLLSKNQAADGAGSRAPG